MSLGEPTTKPPHFPLSRSERQGRLFFLGTLFLLFLWLGLGFNFGLGKAAPRLMVPCFFHKATGLPCSFCGGTRATRSIFKGDFARAAYLNPIAFPVVAITIVLSLVMLAEAIIGKALIPRLPNRVRIVLVTFGAGFLVIWTIWHAWDALRTPKPELVNLSHPLVKFIRAKTGLIPQD